MAMTPKQCARWAAMRQKGRKRFVWLYGALGWGLTTGILFSLIMAAFQGWDRLPILLPLSLVLFPIGGIAWGKKMWDGFESRYQQAMRDQTDT